MKKRSIKQLLKCILLNLNENIAMMKNAKKIKTTECVCVLRALNLAACFILEKCVQLV